MDRYLAAESSVPGNSLDFHRAVVDFRHLNFEEALQHVSVTAGHQDFRALGAASNVKHIHLDALTLLVPFRGHLFVLGHNGLGAPHIQGDSAVSLHLLHHTRDNVLPMLEKFFVKKFSFRLAQPLALLALLLFVWDAARPATSVFLLGSVNNLPAQWIADPAEWPGRLLEWARLGIWLLGPPVVTLSLIGLAVLSRFARGAAPRRTSHSQVYLLHVIAYVALHTLLAFNQYDRYLLPLLPPMILVVSSHLPALPRGRLWKSLSLSLAIALVLAALWSLGNGLPIGGDRGRHDGIEDLARYLNSKPVATVIYDPWLGWELGYYLGQWHDKRRVHYPTAETLAEGALALDEIGDRYLVALVDHGHEDWIAALKTAGFVLSLDYEQNRYIVYRISRPG